MDEENEEVEDVEGSSSDSFADDSDNNESTASGQDDGLHYEVTIVDVPFLSLSLSLFPPPPHFNCLFYIFCISFSIFLLY